MLERIAELNDRVKSARHSDRLYMNSINDATEMIISKRIDPIKTGERYSVQSAQRVRDELYTLVKRAIGTPASDIVPIPADYKSYLLLNVAISDEYLGCTPTNYNQESELLDDPFAKPADDQLYFNERETGFRVFHGDTAIGDYELWYLKNPAVVSIGQPRDKIVTGGTLTNATVYYAYDISVYNGTTYYPGEAITGTGAALTSGTVIIGTKLINSDLPSALQDEVVRLASAIMMGTVENYNKQQTLNNDVDKY